MGGRVPAQPNTPPINQYQGNFNENIKQLPEEPSFDAWPRLWSLSVERLLQANAALGYKPVAKNVVKEKLVFRMFGKEFVLS